MSSKCFKVGGALLQSTKEGKAIWVCVRVVIHADICRLGVVDLCKVLRQVVTGQYVLVGSSVEI